VPPLGTVADSFRGRGSPVGFGRSVPSGRGDGELRGGGGRGEAQSHLRRRNGSEDVYGVGKWVPDEDPGSGRGVIGNGRMGERPPPVGEVCPGAGKGTLGERGRGDGGKVGAPGDPRRAAAPVAGSRVAGEHPTDRGRVYHGHRVPPPHPMGTTRTHTHTPIASAAPLPVRRGAGGGTAPLAFARLALGVPGGPGPGGAPPPRVRRRLGVGLGVGERRTGTVPANRSQGVSRLSGPVVGERVREPWG